MMESKLQLDEHAWNRFVVGGARAAFVGLPHEGTRDRRTDVDEFRRGVGRIRIVLSLLLLLLLFEEVVDVDEYDEVRKRGLTLDFESVVEEGEGGGGDEVDVEGSEEEVPVTPFVLGLVLLGAVPVPVVLSVEA